jgi:hypothetical protein
MQNFKDSEFFSTSHFAPSSKAEHAVGVLYQADYQHEADGTAVAARGHIRALASTGVPLAIKTISSAVLTMKGTFEPIYSHGLSAAVEEEIGEFTRTSISSFYPTIRHLVVHDDKDISTLLMRGAAGPLEDPEVLMSLEDTVFSHTVLYSVWERDRVSKSMARELNRVAQCWVPCTQNAEMLKASGVKNVHVVPHPYDPNSPLCSLTQRKACPKSMGKRFYFIGRWEPRKNPALILESFFRTFSPSDTDVHLTMKYHGSWENYPTPDEVISQIIETTSWDRDSIEEKLTLIDRQLRRDEIWKLHFENNIYVSASAGEAWCLPAFEAKISGNTLIHCPWGGTADFSDPDRDIELEYVFCNVPQSYGWSVGTHWADVKRESLELAFTNVVAPQEFKRPPGFEDKFSLKAVGSTMRELLKDFSNVPLGEYLK